jgi:hypothetical protein
LNTISKANQSEAMYCAVLFRNKENWASSPKKAEAKSSLTSFGYCRSVTQA